MATRKAGGYVFVIYDNDHWPPHVHVFKDGHGAGVLVARVNLMTGSLMDGSDKRHAGRIRKALKKVRW